MCRALIEHMSDHNVRVFVSLAGPQAGMFGRESALVVIQYYLVIAATVQPLYIARIYNLFVCVSSIDAYSRHLPPFQPFLVPNVVKNFLGVSSSASVRNRIYL